MNTQIAILATQSAEMTMTLKEITDILGVRHDKAMAKVTEMAKEAEFGACVQIGHMVDIGSGAQSCIQTYALDKRQSIAVAAKLNTTLLMNIIDRWTELEAAQRAPHRTYTIE